MFIFTTCFNPQLDSLLLVLFRSNLTYHNMLMDLKANFGLAHLWLLTYYSLLKRPHFFSQASLGRHLFQLEDPKIRQEAPSRLGPAKFR